jgi:hypothetical protein
MINLDSDWQGRTCPAALAQAAQRQQAALCGISYRISKEPDIRISRYCPDIGHDILVLATRHPYIPVSGVNIDPDIEENFDIGAISGWQRPSNFEYRTRYRRFFLRYRVS